MTVLIALCLLAAWARSIEVALGGVTLTRIRLDIEKGFVGARALQSWQQRPSTVWLLLAVIQIAALFGAAIVGYNHFRIASFGFAIQSPWLRLTIWVVLVLVLLLVLLLPGALTKQRGAAWARWHMRPLLLLAPIMWPLSYIMGLVVRMLICVDPKTSLDVHWTADELEQRVTATRATTLGKPDEELLLSIIEFSDTKTREIMVPRTGMVALPLGASNQELRQTVIEGGHSRIPVYEDTVDHVIGILHVKDLFRARIRTQDEILTLEKTMLRPAFYVPEVMQISELLRDFQRGKTHMAIVVDEHGGTAGVVTLEDIIEEIVGEIQDEYDIEDQQFKVLTDGKIVADARMNTHELEELLGVSFANDGLFESLGGFLALEFGYLPQTGAVLNWHGLRFTVKDANEKCIRTVEINPKADDA